MTSALLSNHRVIVTGAAGDIGRAIVAACCREGASVMAWDVSEAGLAELSEESSSEIAVETVDVASWEQVEAAAHRAVDRLGGLNGVVNAHGVLGQLLTVMEMPPEEWARVITINLTSVYHTCKAFAPALTRQGSGSIVNIASVAATTGDPELSHYAASKFGVLGFSESLADELGPHGVRVNCVCPGAVESTMHAAVVDVWSKKHGMEPEELEQSNIDATALRALTKPSDVANGVLFYLSDLASFVTRDRMLVSGGWRH